MAKTATGFVGDCEAYDKILYVSKDRLSELSKKLKSKKADEITPKEVEQLMFPEDMDDDAILVPVDISGEGDDFPTDHEELVEKLGAKAAVEAMVRAADLFKASSKKFKKDQLPLPMSAGEWMTELGLLDGSSGEGAEEQGEEEDLEEDEEVDPEPATKKRKAS
eukprot:CAMPEP_0115123592 /NCGR_PEP_ID=MMETSP0227-20121206/47642_1 /TAXON_ID=89957 /ORGANISM="Polarella glacialis, Strain CCMP 1383" /LENGTH=163 /DNA_ID=CAMNT_0002526009 /DNA_START=40 /DNA_END=531 /DNA_ORIENTATION=-